MKNRNKVLVFLVLLASISFLLNACALKSQKVTKLRDLEFTVVSEECLPEELLTIITEKKVNSFKMTYNDKKYMYICVGYGEQKTGGYSITVNELYLTDNAIYIDTNLLGPNSEDKKTEATSFPCIVVKIEMIDKTVVFD